jgi:acyl carrier protein
MNSLEQRVKEVVASQFKVKLSNLNLNTNFIITLGADSVDMFELALSLEAEFKISIPTEDYTKLTSICIILDYLKRMY